MIIGGYGQGPRNRVLDAVLLRPAALGASAFGPTSDCPRLAWRLPALSSGLRPVFAKLPEPPRHPHPSGSVSARASWLRRLWLGAARAPRRLVPALTPMRARSRVWPAANAPRPVRRGGRLSHRSHRRALECAVPCRSFINSDRAVQQGGVALDGLARLIATSASCGSFAALRSGIALSLMGGPVHVLRSPPRLPT